MFPSQSALTAGWVTGLIRKDIRPVEIAVPIFHADSVLEQVQETSEWDNWPTYVQLETDIKMELVAILFTVTTLNLQWFWNEVQLNSS